MTAINKYNKSMIYTIRSPTTDKYYIGSTTQILCKRFSDHKTNYKAYLKGSTRFITSFKILELDNAYIELLEEVICENRNQLEKKEGELIRLHANNCVNINIAGRTKKDYYIDNKDIIIDKIKHYKNVNKDIIKQYYIDNRESLLMCHKQYRIDNKESLKQMRKLKAKTTLPFLCTCGSTIQPRSKLIHNKSNKHIKSLEKLIDI